MVACGKANSAIMSNTSPALVIITSLNVPAASKKYQKLTKKNTS
jgi:hypothetical protein